MTVPAEWVLGAISGLAAAVGWLYRRHDTSQNDRINEYRDQLLPAVNTLAESFKALAAQVSRVLDVVEQGGPR